MPPWSLPTVTLPALERLAELLALYVRGGDLILLEGDLGAGKTTFARAFIRALAADALLEVPSPTFALLQSYETHRLTVHHFDLYRLGGPADVREIGFEDALTAGLVLVEWPDRADGLLPPERLTVQLADGPDADHRRVTLAGTGGWAERLAHIGRVHGFLSGTAWRDATVAHLAGDASRRSYARLTSSTGTCLLMDSPPLAPLPIVRDGKPYWAIARSAPDVRSFVAVGEALASYGLSVPALLARNTDDGLLLVEDLGDSTFGVALQAGAPMGDLTRAACDVLTELAQRPVPSFLPPYDHGALMIEAKLLLDWYWPHATGRPPWPEQVSQFEELWTEALAPVLVTAPAWVLRDVHSPNLIWLPQRTGLQRVGVIDFQDALAGHAAYDLASLLFDARLDVPEALEQELLAYSIAQRTNREPHFDADHFRLAYATLAAQRNTKILGIFARLAKRDGKPEYLRHLPRIKGYLKRALAHEGLADLRDWYQRNLPGT
jgi:N-acetylmuramate 1-kinase